MLPFVILREAAGSMQRLDCSDFASHRAAMTKRRGGVLRKRKPL